MRPSSRFSLPINSLIDRGALLIGGAPQVYTCSLNAFVSHQVSKKSNVWVLCYEILGKSMPEGMRVNDIGIDSIAFRAAFESERYAPCAHWIPIGADEHEPLYV